MNNRGVRSNGGFKMLAPAPVGYWDPSQAGMPTKPTKPPHRTVTMGVITANQGPITNGLLTGSTFSKATGSFTVADNTFPAPVELILGDYRLVNTIDYAVSAIAAANTATNIAAAISKVTGYKASAIGATVTVLCDYQADDIEFRAVHYGNVISLNAFTGSGYLTLGVPYAGPPVLT